MPLNAYYDDSGTDAASKVTVIGGPVMSEGAFMDFDGDWIQLLDFYRISPPLHMKDFSGRGKHSGLSVGVRRELFGKAASLINEYKLFSVSIGISQPAFNSLLPRKICGRQF